MTNEVIDLDKFRPKKVERVFGCKCDEQLFWLHVDGTIECRGCKTIVECIEWIAREGYNISDKNK